MKARVRSALVDATPDDRSFHRAFIQSRCWEAADHFPALNDAEEIVRLSQAVGDIAAGYTIGHSDLAYEVETLISAAFSWRERMAEQARCATKTDTQREAA